MGINTENQSESRTVPQYDWRFSWPWTLAATAAVSAALTAGANDHGVLPEVTLIPEEVIPTDTGTTVGVEHWIEDPWREAVVEKVVIQINRDYQGEVAAPWARLFDQDPDAVEYDRNGLTDVLTAIKEAYAIGADNIRITVTGRASAEDLGTEDDQAGLQIPSEDNQNLAQIRAESFATDIQSELTSLGLPIPEIDIETSESALSDQEADTMQALAERYGYDTVRSMIEQWNRTPDKSPDAVAALLDALLKAERSTIVTMEADGEIAMVVTRYIDHDGQCFTEVTTTDHLLMVHIPELNITIPIIFPFPISLWRRAEEDVEKVPEAVDEGGGRPNLRIVEGIQDEKIPPPDVREVTLAVARRRRFLGRVSTVLMPIFIAAGWWGAGLQADGCAVNIDKEEGSWGVEAFELGNPLDCLGSKAAPAAEDLGGTVIKLWCPAGYPTTDLEAYNLVVTDTSG